MKKHLEEACLSLIGAAVSLIAPSLVSAHIFDERPGLGTGMTIILAAFWVAVVIGIVFFVRRLMRPQSSNDYRVRKKQSQGEKRKTD